MNFSPVRVPPPQPVRILHTVPPVSGVRERRRPTPSTMPPPSTPVRRIAVIDADAPRRSSLVEALSAEGYTTVSLTPIDDAFELAGVSGPDLMLIEAGHPDGLGVELCRKLRAVDGVHLHPVVLYGGGACDEETVLAGLHAGADDFVAGPVRVSELKARVGIQLRNLRDRELLLWTRRQRSTYRDEAYTDPLTGLANRRGIDRRLTATLAGQAPAFCVLLDLDHFKTINDTWGHAVGDEVLRRIGATIDAFAPSEDMVGRVGGEEFLAVVRAAPEQAQAVGERYRKVIGETVFPSDLGPRRVTASVGVAGWDGTPPSPTSAVLFARADEALYEAKRTGRDRVSVHAW